MTSPLPALRSNLIPVFTDFTANLPMNASRNDEFIKARDKYYQIVSKKDDQAFPSQPLGNLEVTQENVHLLIPSKLSWMANMLAEDKGISIVEAMKMLYSSEVYARLEKESTKAWHLGPVALYEEFQNN